MSFNTHTTSEYEQATAFKRLQLRLLRRFMRYAVTHSIAVVAVSKGIASDAQIFSMASNLHIVYNPVDVWRFNPRYVKPQKLAAIPADTRLIIFVVRFVFEKRLDVLIEAFRRVRACFDAKSALVCR